MEIKFRRIVNSILVILLFSTSSLEAQETGVQINPRYSRDSLLKVAHMVIDSTKECVFITVDENGKPYARTMSPFPPEKNWTVWLGTSQGSRKTVQIQKNPNVIVYYFDQKGYSYVSIAGKARLVNDSDKKSKYWVESWKRYYPDREKNYILIEVIPQNLEIISYKNNIFWNSKGDPQSVDFVTTEAKK